MASKGQAALAPVRSAFTAASLVPLPGLGHAYLRRWLRTTLLSMAMPSARPSWSASRWSSSDGGTLAQLVSERAGAVLLFIVLDALARGGGDARRPGGWHETRWWEPAPGGHRPRGADRGHRARAGARRPGGRGRMPVAAPPGRGRHLRRRMGQTGPIPDIDELPPDVHDLRLRHGRTRSSQLRRGPDGRRGRSAALGSSPGTGASASTSSGRPRQRAARGERTYLTDTMMVVSIDPVAGQLRLGSLPRDTVRCRCPGPRTSPRPGWSGQQVRRAHELALHHRAAVETTSSRQRSEPRVSSLDGCPLGAVRLNIQYYVAVDLNSFRGAVNAFGGLVVDVSCRSSTTGTPPPMDAAS